MSCLWVVLPKSRLIEETDKAWLIEHNGRRALVSKAEAERDSRTTWSMPAYLAWVNFGVA